MSRVKKQNTGISDQLPLAMKTGTYVCGFRQTINSLVSGNCEAIVLTRNYPSSKRKLIEYYAMFFKSIPVLSYDGTNNDLAKLVDKYHRVGVVAIMDQGEADLIKI